MSTTWAHSTETSVRHSKSPEMWSGQMCRISLPMGRDCVTCLPLRKEPPHHKAHCRRESTHCIPWRPAMSTRRHAGPDAVEWLSKLYMKLRVSQTNNNNVGLPRLLAVPDLQRSRCSICYGPRAFRAPALLLRFFYKNKIK